MMTAWMMKSLRGLPGSYTLGAWAPLSRMDCAAALEAGAEAATLRVTKLPAVAVMVGVKVVSRATAALVAALNADVTVAILLAFFHSRSQPFRARIPETCA